MQVSQTGQTWLSSLDLKKLRRRTSASSNHGAVILESPSSPVSSQDPNWYKRIACCQLESGRGTGQGVLVHLDQFSEVLNLGENLQLGLLTNHHIIPSKYHVNGWKLHIGPEGNKKVFMLNDSMFTHCFSCCGPDGIWSDREAHFQQSASDPPTPCPLRRDFSLLILAPSFVSDLGSKLSQKDNPLLVFPPLHAPDKEEHCRMEFCILQRDLSGSIDAGQIQLQSIAPPTDDSSLEREVIAYKECCILRYPHNWVTKIGKGSSGSGIFCQDEGTGDIRLAGIHVSSEVDGGKMHYGLTVHAIVHSVAGGPTCGIIPALSLLKDASMHNCLAAHWYEKLQNCLNPEEINLNRFLKIVDFLLKAEPSIFMFTLGNPAVLPSLRLLAFLFGCFSKFESSKIFEMAERVLKTDGKLALFQNVKELCNRVHKLLKEANQQNNKDVVEACFQCWYDMHEFGAPVYEVLYESAKISSLRRIREDKYYEDCVTVHRMFGNIFMAYEAYQRGSEQRKYQTELREQAQQFDAEREALEKKVQQYTVEMRQDIQKWEHQLAEERKKREDLEQQCQDQKQQLAEERKRGEDLEQQCQDQNHQLAEERRRGEDLEQNYQDQTQQLAEERKRRGELDQQLREKEQELAAEKKKGEQFEQRYQYERKKHDQEMLQTNLALEQLKAEKHRLDEENERQAIRISKTEEQLELLNRKCESQDQEIQQLQVQLQPRSFPLRRSTFPTANLYPTRKETTSFLVPDSEKAFWDRNMATLLKEDVHGVRAKVGELYCKVQGGSGGDWEQLLNYLDLKMDASKLETQPPGDIILQIVQFWEKRENVTVCRFCEVSMHIGIDSVAQVLQEAEHRNLGTTLRDSSLSSEPHDI